MQNKSSSIEFNSRFPYPFTAVVGKEGVKKAIIMNAVNPRVGGVLIVGEKGTAKSTLVRSFSQVLPDIKIINLPLNVSEDRLVGSLDLKYAVEKGEKRLEPGLFYRAHKNILYIDEVNLLSDSIVKIILDVSANGINTIEREGMSYSHPAQFTLIGTMNPEEGLLSSGFVDRFGLYVEVKGEKEVVNRLEVIKRRMEYESNPEDFCHKYKKSIEALKEKILKARRLIRDINIPKEILKASVEICRTANCSGHRGDICLVEASKSIAALDDRKEVEISDLKEAAIYVLPHRMKNPKETSSKEPNQQKNDNTPKDDGSEKSREKEPLENNNKAETNFEDNNDKGSNNPSMDNDRDSLEKTKIEMEEDISEIGESFNVKDINIDINDSIIRKSSGKRSKTRTGTFQGRYVKAIIPKGKPNDIAIDATLRTAAIFQKQRRRVDRLIIKESDFRKKVREKRTGNSLLFVVDASGSMGAKMRMKAVKGAIMSLLMDAYQKRDRVGMIAFRREGAEELLQLTRSIDFAKEKLKSLPTGGKTPLSAGLYKGYQILKSSMLKDKDSIPVMILITDGKANKALWDGDPIEETIDICEKLSQHGIKSLVIDTEAGFIQMGLAKEIARALNAQYSKLEDLKDKNIEGAVREFIL